MYAKDFVNEMGRIGIHSLVGIPDSTLRELCSYISTTDEIKLMHYTPANEGAAVGIAIGNYLATGSPSCVYMQNSGIGNAINPLTSLSHRDVYGIPMLLVIGWRGEPGIYDEPQHKFMGKITREILSCLEIKSTIVDSKVEPLQIRHIFDEAKEEMYRNRQYAIIIKRDTFTGTAGKYFTNSHTLKREDAIRNITKFLNQEDVIVSTTGKISRELYEIDEKLNGNHKRDFLTVGGMGHASMIAFGLAVHKSQGHVYCLDGDGAVLMHMGALPFLGKEKPSNLIHVCLNNEAHESVGGMPTGAAGVTYADIAASCGYEKTYTVNDLIGLRECMVKICKSTELTFLEVKVAMYSRNDLGRPKESTYENKNGFMNYYKGDK